MFLFTNFFLINSLLTYCLPNLFPIPLKVIDSLNIITNSAIIGTSSYMYLNNIISYNTQKICMTYTLSFLLNDIIFKYINKDNQFPIKLAHHVIAGYAIYRFPYVSKFISLLFLTELTNLPLESRFISINFNFDRYYFRETMVAILYTSFFYLRIYYVPYYYYYNHQNLNLNIPDQIALFSIYSMWWYWFVLLNKKIVEKVKESCYQKFSVWFKKQIKNSE